MWTMIQYQFQSMAQFQGMSAVIWLFYVKSRIKNALHYVFFRRQRGAFKGLKPSDYEELENYLKA